MNQQKEYNTHLLNEIRSISLEDSLESMEENFNKLSNSEDLNLSFNEILNILQNDQNGVRVKLSEAGSLLKKTINISNGYKSIFERIESVIIELDDIARDLKLENDSIEFNTEMKEILNQKLEKIYSLFRKHDVISINDLLKIKQELEKKLSETEQLDDTIKRYKIKSVKLSSKLDELSKEIRRNRKTVIPFLKDQMEILLSDMGMLNTIFKIELYDSEIFLKNGKDKLKLSFSANKGGAFGPLNKTASGGELSRIMLSLKYILSKYKNLPTIIFDEIDTGVSGEVANSIGRIMKSMGKKMQVISITHLPQVAAKANNQLKVYKTFKNQVASTKLKNLNFSQRISEIAEMLSGDESADTAYDLAKELLN